MKMLLSLVMMISLSAFADHHEPKEQKMGNPCKADIEKLCAGIEPGDGRMMKCMKDNEDKMSAECKAKRSEMKEKMKDAHEACHEDIEKLCNDVSPGKGRIIKCLKRHKDELSQGCKDATARKKK